MPCGGIRPVTDGAEYRCFHCNTKGCDHFVEEWDAFLHGSCVVKFLQGEEGELVVNHKHHIQVGDVILQYEDGEFMDPNKCLSVIREVGPEIHRIVDAEDVEALSNQEGFEKIIRYLEHVEALDFWMQQGGLAPADWKR